MLFRLVDGNNDAQKRLSVHSLTSDGYLIIFLTARFNRLFAFWAVLLWNAYFSAIFTKSAFFPDRAALSVTNGLYICLGRK